MAEEQANQKSVSMLVYPGVSMLELTGAYSTFNGMKMAKYEVSVVAEHREALDSDTPLKIVPHKEFSELPAPSVLVVMGGGLPSLRALGNAALLQYIHNAVYTAGSVIGIGCGALLLAACGLLENRPAATHWAFASLLEAFGARYVR